MFATQTIKNAGKVILRLLAMRIRREGIWGGWVIVMDTIRTFSACALCVLALQNVSNAAGFSTNFNITASESWVNEVGSCSFASTVCPVQFGNGDPTPFQLTLVTVGSQTYFHTIVGDPASGFAIESYTPYGAGPSPTHTAGDNMILEGDFSPTGGGNEQRYIGAGDPLDWLYMRNNTNMSNVFGDYHASGSGSQTPSSTVFRMVMTSADGTMSMEVDKPFLDKKPMISQTIQDGTMSSVFVADMRALSYSDMNTPIKITNSLTINDSTIPTGSGNFEMALAQHSDVTAGRYTFDATGVGWDTIYGWDSLDSHYQYGTYHYAEGTGFDPLTFDWASVFDYSQNALNCSRARITGDNRNQNAGGASCPGHP